MDIHRCRFVPYQPQAINALAFSHISSPKQHTPKDLKLAVGRENGDIELWNPSRGEWLQERVFRGGVGRTVEQIAWTQDIVLLDEDESGPQQKYESGPLRLFSSGGSPSITEWDLEKGVPKRHAEGNFGDIWCFAPQPQWTQAQAKSNAIEARAAPSQLLAAGCSDGSILLFSTADNELRYDRVVTRPLARKSRCISVTWRDRNTIVAGFEESVIRVIDINLKRVIRNLSLGKSKDGPQPLVWAVRCLSNGTILSGDSSGELKVWDAQNLSLLQRLKTHNADVLDITTNHAGNMIFTCGVDRRTIAYAPQPNPTNSKVVRWAELRHRRFHEHDVKAIVSFESKSLSIAVSGGMDTVPVVLPLKNWNDEYHRSLSHLPSKPQISVSSRARLMLTFWQRDLFIWHLPPRYRDFADTDSISDDQSNNKLLARIRLKGDEYITSAEISSSGNMIAASTSTGVKLFQIRRIASLQGQPEIRSRPIELPKMLGAQGSATAGFSPDSKWLYVVRLSNVLIMAKIAQAATPKERPTIHERIIKLDRRERAPKNEQTALGKYHRHITSVAFSADSRILAVGDLSGAIDTWILEGHEASPVDDAQQSDSELGNDFDDDSDSEDETDSRIVDGQKWIRTPAGSQLPSLESAVLTLAFKPPLSLVQTTDPAGVHDDLGLHATRNNPHPIAHELPAPKIGFLVAITANHQIVEFDALHCKLSEWSRRNPSGLLPQKFKQIKDRVMGCWFDVRQGIERLWLYGANFIYMIDMSRDLQTTAQEAESVKIGRLGEHLLTADSDHAIVKQESDGQSESTHKTRKRKANAGAGDEMRQGQKYSVKMRRLISDEHEGVEDAKLALPSPPGSDDEDETGFDEEEDQTYRARRRQHSNPKHENGEAIDVNEENTAKQGPASWHTFQYRGIYGISALKADVSELGVDAEEGDHDQAPEVVIIERPMYDVELLPRFTSGQEW